MTYARYIRVWLALLVLTAITVTTASLNFGRISIAVVLAIAAAWLRPRGPSTKAPGLPPTDPAGPRGA
jgi:hypothetical protein